MPRKLWLSLFVVLASCNNGPDVTVCLVDAKNQTLECSNADGKKATLKLDDADNFVCFSPTDTERLLRAYNQAGGGCLP
jgi:hypothetical protein